MSLAKRTYSLPPDLLDQFEARVNAGERSPMIAKLLGEWLAELRREELRRRVIEGCREMAEVYQDIDEEWAGAADEVWRATE